MQIYPDKHFEGITSKTWIYHIGGYQMLNRYLKDRKGMSLADPILYRAVSNKKSPGCPGLYMVSMILFEHHDLFHFRGIANINPNKIQTRASRAVTIISTIPNNFMKSSGYASVNQIFDQLTTNIVY